MSLPAVGDKLWVGLQRLENVGGEATMRIVLEQLALLGVGGAFPRFKLVSTLDGPHAVVWKPSERVFWVLRLAAGVEHLAAGQFNADFAELDGG
jgi:hypothetical protein